MKTFLNTLFISLLVVGILVLTGCANKPVEAQRAGCTYIDGVARTGTLFQYAKGKAKGAHVYVGENMKKAKITCNADKQEVKVGS